MEASAHHGVSKSQDTSPIESHRGMSPDQTAAGLTDAAKQLATLLAAAADIQEALQSASEQHAQLLRDLTALQRGIRQESLADGTTVKDSIHQAQMEGILASPSQKCRHHCI